MILDAIRLLLFPALMAFAASSDLLTMTISNRLSLALAGGFLLLALVTGMSLAASACISPPAALVLVVRFRAFRAAGSAAATPSSRPRPRCGSASSYLLDYLLYASLFGGVLTLLLIQFRILPLPARWRARPGSSACTRKAAACPTASRSPPRRSWSIRNTGWMRALTALIVADARRAQARNTILTRFSHRSLTIP